VRDANVQLAGALGDRRDLGAADAGIDDDGLALGGE
jgi:hypothetical protein